MDPPRLEEFFRSQWDLRYGAADNGVGLIVKKSPQYQEKSSLDCRREVFRGELVIEGAIGVIVCDANGHLKIVRHKGVERSIISEPEVCVCCFY